MSSATTGDAAARPVEVAQPMKSEQAQTQQRLRAHLAELGHLSGRRSGSGGDHRPWLVLVLLACGPVELVAQHPARPAGRQIRQQRETTAPGVVQLSVGTFTAGSLGKLAWLAIKVGALSYGGGFVIIPLMQSDAVNTTGG